MCLPGSQVTAITLCPLREKHARAFSRPLEMLGPKPRKESKLLHAVLSLAVIHPVPGVIHPVPGVIHPVPGIIRFIIDALTAVPW